MPKLKLDSGFASFFVSVIAVIAGSELWIVVVAVSNKSGSACDGSGSLGESSETDGGDILKDAISIRCLFCSMVLIKLLRAS